MGVTLSQKGNFNDTTNYLKKLLDKSWMHPLDKYGQEGVDALFNATPKDTGTTANSWYYKIDRNLATNEISLTWYNKNVNNGVNVALVIQYGHATGFGGYVHGIDYINPALKPVFDKLAQEVWEEVTKV